jgi:hypothetical protein
MISAVSKRLTRYLNAAMSLSLPLPMAHTGNGDMARALVWDDERMGEYDVLKFKPPALRPV